MRSDPRRAVSFSVLLLGLVLLPSCAALQSFAALGRVDFSLQRVHGLQLAGVPIERIGSFEELGGSEVLRLGLALSEGELPLELTLDVGAANPTDNPEARLLGMDWTLLLDGRETISGALDREIRMPAGETTTVPVGARLDLLEFFDGGLEELVDLAAGLTGVSGEPTRIRMEVTPTVETALGPIRYPRPLVLER